MKVTAQTQDVLQWTEVDMPSSMGNIIVQGSDVSRIAVSTSNTIYAIHSDNLTGTDNFFYRSTNSGATWSDITLTVRSFVPVTEIFVDISVAPDKPSVVALVTLTAALTNKVYVSTDGGDIWYDTNLPSSPGITVQSIAVSRGFYKTGTTLYWDIAIGTADWGNGTTDGLVWVLQVSDAIATWKLQNDLAVPNADVSAIAFSSKYGEDQTIMMVASTEAAVITTSFYLGKRDVWAQSTIWNSVVTPINIAIDNDTNVRKIISCIALPSDYNGTSSASRIAFVSYNVKYFVPPAITYDSINNDVYRVQDGSSPQVLRLNAAGASANISSITFNGSISTGSAGVPSGILVAGDYYPGAWPYVQVRRCLNPFDTPVSWQTATKPPTGPGSAQVAWSSSGTQLFCGTSQIVEFAPPVPDESAFSISKDNGNTWEQTSLIDTVVYICDIMPAPDSKSLFIAAYNDFTLESVWRTAGTPLGTYWGRILSTDTTTNRLLLRLSPNYRDDYTIYAAEENGSYIAVSHDRGNFWYEYSMPSPMVDLTVADEETVYVALPDGMIRKSENEGKVWGFPYVTWLDNINMIKLTNDGDMLVGSQDGKVAYSTDNCTSFTIIPQPVGNASNIGDVQITPDSDYTENNIIYASTNITDTGIWRWTVNTSTEWEWIDKDVVDLNTGERFCGMVTGDEGTLYALRMEPADGAGSGGMNRSLNPDISPALEVEWDILNRTLPAGTAFDPDILYSHTLPFLRISGNQDENVLWSVSTDNMTDQHIYQFVDNICKKGAWREDIGQIGCDPASGRNQGISFIWEQLSLSDEYEINIAKDGDFSMRLASIEPETNPYYPPFQVTQPAYIINAGQVLECGHNFYWRVRTRHAASGEFIRSPWSETDSFVVKAGYMVTTPYYGPQLLAPDNGCGCSCNSPVCFSWTPFKEARAYRIELSENYDMTYPLVSTVVEATTAFQYAGNLECGKGYFWRVMSTDPVGDWSSVNTFVISQNQNAAVQQEVSVQTSSLIPLWGWIVIGISFLLIVLIIFLTMYFRNYNR